MDYVYVGSELWTVYITGKHIEDGRGRLGQTTKRLAIETDKGSMPFLKYPIIGYSFGADEVYAGFSPDVSLQVRIGQWPPRIIG